MRKYNLSRTLFAGAMILAAGLSWAGDGVVEINQARALAGGVTAADAPGFPVTVCTGSYRLTSDLVLTGGDVALNVIEVGCDGATIDLNGFRIQGYGICQGNPGAGCGNGAGPGSGVAVVANSGGGNFVTVKDGTITGMFGSGVNLGREVRVQHLTAFRNGGNGVNVGDGSLVEDVNASNNAGSGIRSDSGGPLVTRIRNVHVEVNGGSGVITSGPVEGLVAIENLDSNMVGFYQVEAGSVDGCTVAGTARNGINAGTVRNCTVQGLTGVQALIAEDNFVWGDDTGIFCSTCRRNFVVGGFFGIQASTTGGFAPAIVTDNQVSATICLVLQSSTGYRDNTFTCGSVSGGINLGGNICASSLCP